MFLLALLLSCFSNRATAQTYSQSYATAGTFSFTPLPGVTSVTVECWGGGGAGGGATGYPAAGGGGSGGAYVRNGSITVIPGNSYTVTVGAGGTGSYSAGGAGGSSWFNSTGTILAVGGAGGAVAISNNSSAPGAAAVTTGNVGGTVNYYGGAGGTGGANGASGGGGGGSAGIGSNGNSAAGVTGGAAVTGGGAGANGSTSSADGVPGSSPGGGGAGGHAGSTTDRRGGSGGTGQVKVSWTCSLNLSNYSVSASGACAGNGSTVTITSSTLATGTYTVYYNLTGANSATAQSATMNFTAGSPGSGTFSTIALSNSGSTTITITSIGCASLTTGNTATFNVSTTPSNIRITFTQFQHDIEFITTTACGIIDPGGENDLDICISSYNGCSGSYNPVAGDTYQWEESQTPSGPWNSIGLGPTSTQTQFVLDPDYVNYLMVAGDYYFRLKVTRNGCTGISEVIHLHVNVSSNLTGGTIASDQTFPCGGSATPARLTGTPAIGGLSGSNGIKHYQWQYSTDGINFTDFSTRDTLRNYFDPPPITQTTWYRRYVVSGGCRSFSNAVKVTLNVTPQPGVISGPTPVCANSTGLFYNIAAVPGAESYNWTVPTGWNITGNTGTAITVTAGNIGQNGNITVTAYVPACGTSTPSILPVSVATPVTLTVNSTSVVEGCTGQIILSRDPAYVTQPATVNLIYSGTAINGTDFTSGGVALPTSVTIPASQSSVTIPYLAVADGINEGSETVNIQLSQLCPCTDPECSTKTITIYDPLAITATASNVSCGVSNGVITVNATYGTPGIIQYSINGGVNWQTSNLFTGLAPGPYNVWAKDPGSCIDHVTTTATVSEPTGIIANAGPDLPVCSGESVQLQGSGGTIYSWSPADGLSDPNIPNPVASPSSTTTYTLTVKVPDGSGDYCTDTDDMIVTVNSKPVVTINPVNPVICNGSSVTLTASGGGTYSWVSPPGTNPSITVNPTADASYTVIVTAANGCTGNATANVTVHPLSTAVLSGTGNICIGDAATINLSLTGNGPWTVTYTDGTTPVTTSPISSYSYDISVSPLTTTTYTLVSATDAFGCAVSVSGSATVIVTPVPVIGPSPPAECSAYGLYETFSIQSIPGVTYQWQENRNDGTGWHDLIYNVWYQYWGIRDYSLMVWVPDATKNGYQYRCVVTSSCVQTSGSATLTVYETPYVDLPLSAFLCTGSSLTLTPTLIGHDPGPYTWQWYKNTILLPGETGNTLLVTSGGDYQVRVTNTRNGCNWTRVPVTVTEYPVMPAVSVSIEASSNPICSGTSVTFTATPGAPYNDPGWQSQLVFQWKLNGSNVGGNSNTYTYDGLVNGDVITCTLTVNNLMCSPSTQATSNTITMTVNPIVTVSVSISANQTFPVCPGTQVTFTATPVNGGTAPMFQWYKDGSIITGATGQTYTTSPLAWGDAYAITCKLTSSLTDPCLQNNPATSTAISVSVKPPPPLFNVSSFGSACESGGVTVYTDYSDPFSTYYLQRDGSDIVPLISLPGNIDYTSVYFPPQYVAGVYTVRAEYNGCTRLMNGFITIVNTLPTIVLGSNPSVCKGTTTANLTYSATTYTPDQYSVDYDPTANGAGFVDVTNASLPVSPIVLTVSAGAAAGVYNGTLTVKNSTSGCVSVGYPITVTINALPTITGSSNVCPGKTTQWTANPAGGSWHSNNESIATVDNNGLVTGVASGITSITYTDNNGCIKSMTIGVGAVVTITAQPQNKAGCYGGNVTFSVSYSYSGQVIYNWYRIGTSEPISPGSTTSSPIQLTLNNIGSNGNVNGSQYWVEIGPSAMGCMISSGTATLTINSTPNCTITGGVEAVCAGTTTTWRATAGMSSYSWSGPGSFSASTKDITIGTAGTYTVTITDANGCQSTCSRTLTVNPLPNTSLIYHQ